MLTNDDLKQLRTLVREEIASELKPVKEELQGVKTDVKGVKEELQGVKTDVKGVKEELQGVKTDVKGVKEELQEVKVEVKGIDHKIDAKLKPIRKDLNYLKKTLRIVVKNYDEGDVKLERRVAKIEKHLGLPQGN